MSNYPPGCTDRDIDRAAGAFEPCEACAGRGWVACWSGDLDCADCKGTGTVDCEECENTDNREG